MKNVILNFTNRLLSPDTLNQFDKPPVLQCPLSVTQDMDLTQYVDNVLDSISISVESDVSYLVVLPGLPVLAGMVCRNLSERQIPYQIINFVRSPETGEFTVQGVY